MRRRLGNRALHVTALLVVLAAIACWTSSTAPPRRRSAILYLVDTLRADHLGVYGYGRPTSPFLERLASEGVVFERCFAQAPWTKPSMASLLTSRHPSATGIRALTDRLDDSFVTLPEAVRAHGYYTAAFSTNPIMGHFSNYDQGFQQFREAVQIIPKGDPFGFASGSAAALNRAIFPWLSSGPPSPFFLYVHSMDPHEEYKPAAAVARLFADSAGEVRYRKQWDALKSANDGQLANHCNRGTFDKTGVNPNEFIDYGTRLYDADIRANDTAMADLWDHLRALGLEKDLVFVITSDHGEEFFEHGGTSHGYSLYNELLHVPLIIWAPGLLPRGVRISEPVRLLDVYPTVLDLLHLDIPRDIDGESLMPLIMGHATGAKRVIHSEKRDWPDSSFGTFRTGAAVSAISWPWKYIHNLAPVAGEESRPEELYDIAADPGETHDVAAEHRDLAAQLAAEVRSWEDAHPSSGQGVAWRPAPSPDAATMERLRRLGYVQ